MNDAAAETRLRTVLMLDELRRLERQVPSSVSARLAASHMHLCGSVSPVAIEAARRASVRG